MVYWIVAVKVHPGQEAKFKEISAQLIELTRAEEGTLSYEWNLGEDGTCHIYERYVDSAAVMLHGKRSASLVGQLFAVSTLLGFTIYGSPSDEVKQMLAGENPVYLKPLGGFSR